MLLEDLQPKINFYKVLRIHHRVSFVNGYPIQIPETFSVSSYLALNSDFMFLEFPNLATGVGRSNRNLKVLEVTYTSNEEFIKRKLTFTVQDTRQQETQFDPEIKSDIFKVNLKALQLNQLTTEAREIAFKVKYFNGLDNVTTECVIPIPLILNQEERSCKDC